MEKATFRICYVALFLAIAVLLSFSLISDREILALVFGVLFGAVTAAGRSYALHMSEITGLRALVDQLARSVPMGGSDGR